MAAISRANSLLLLAGEARTLHGCPRRDAPSSAQEAHAIAPRPAAPPCMARAGNRADAGLGETMSHVAARVADTQLPTLSLAFSSADREDPASGALLRMCTTAAENGFDWSAPKLPFGAAGLSRSGRCRAAAGLDQNCPCRYARSVGLSAVGRRRIDSAKALMPQTVYPLRVLVWKKLVEGGGDPESSGLPNLIGHLVRDGTKAFVLSARMSSPLQVRCRLLRWVLMPTPCPACARCLARATSSSSTLHCSTVT